MRPQILFPLFADTTSLGGVGPKTRKLFEKLAGPRIVDLLWLLPTGVIDRSLRTTAARAPEGAIVTLTVEVEAHTPPRRSSAPYRIRCHDASGFLDLVFFHADRSWLERALPVGATRLVSGRIEHYQGRLQMGHPDYILPPEAADQLPLHEPVYPLTAGLSAKAVQRAVRDALSRVPPLPEWQDPDWLNAQGWPSFKPALIAAHGPRQNADTDPLVPARQRLAYDELLASQLALALMRARLRRTKGVAHIGSGRLTAPVRAALPYRLTGAQERALSEIIADMAGPQRMLRLLQGDVGSGKTVVAMLAMLTAVEAGTQAALMAPTEILARQHYATMAPLAAAAGVELALLTGREKGQTRDRVVDALARGTLPMVVGTHALFQEQVSFKALGLAVVDEQHRFGVHQRLALSDKSEGRADVLVMTATPIPRTLTLTYYGDMDSSRLDEKPPGRTPVTTRAVPLSRLEEVVRAVGNALERGERAYWVCPLVDESELVDAAAAEARFEALKTALGDQVGLVHGRMKPAQKDKAMADFQAGKITLLVATTVIEVGVDVPEATIMVIEHAERFGLAQLHQLRGRVGRGARAGNCVLLYQTPLGDTARARIRILRETDDGFRIAEEDLRLRGAGEVLGVKQSGAPAFRLAHIPEHETLLGAAHDDARLVLGQDPELAGERGQALRVLLYLFERDEAIRYLRSG